MKLAAAFVAGAVALAATVVLVLLRKLDVSLAGMRFP